ncbi:MAG: DotU family type secretion system protein [Nevskia sp.]|nr:DotU family type secretion system protein [Nevskia sp.]
MNDDPFSAPDQNRTVILPTPGGRGRDDGAIRRPAAPDQTDYGADLQVAPSGLNPLLAAANPLLNLAPQIRATLHHPNPGALRDSLVRSIREFDQRAKAAGVPGEQIIAARYALCTLLDEAAASTPWGSGAWSGASLLVLVHNEAWGGEKFFVLLSKLAEQPEVHRDLLELMYVCLCLGLEGRYRVLDNGRAQLESLRDRLAQLLRRKAGDAGRELSPHWQGAAVQARRLFDALPLWVALCVLALLTLGTYLAFNYSLNAASDPVYASIGNLRAKGANAAPRPLPAAAPLADKPRLAGLLAGEIAQGQLAVRDERGRSVVTIRGDGLFAPGSATLASEYVGVLRQIGAALKAVPGKVEIVGHTDNQPIRSTRFPSNWHLSQERARTVLAQLQETIPDAGRMRADGRADSEPIASNASAEGRARNRRVDIILTPAPNVP